MKKHYAYESPFKMRDKERKINKKKREIKDFLELFQICHKHLGSKESIKKARRWSKEFVK